MRTPQGMSAGSIVIVPPFENVNVYGALAAALRLTAQPNDGDAAVWRTFLR